MGGFEEAAVLARELLDGLHGEAVRVITRWALVALFATAGVTKLRRPMLAALAIADFGVFGRPRKALGAALGATEVLVAVLIAIPPTSQAGTLFALVLLCSFVVITGRALISKRDVACFCLGDPESRISTWSTVRTGALAAVVAAQIAGASTVSTPTVVDNVLYLVAAFGGFVTALLVARVPRLLRWNSDVVRFVEEEVG